MKKLITLFTRKVVLSRVEICVSCCWEVMLSALQQTVSSTHVLKTLTLNEIIMDAIQQPKHIPPAEVSYSCYHFAGKSKSPSQERWKQTMLTLPVANNTCLNECEFLIVPTHWKPSQAHTLKSRLRRAELALQSDSIYIYIYIYTHTQICLIHQIWNVSTYTICTRI